MHLSAHSVAVSKGYPYIDGGGGEGRENIWFNRFSKNNERTGPYLYVGFDECKRRWIIHEGKLPDEQ